VLPPLPPLPPPPEPVPQPTRRVFPVLLPDSAELAARVPVPLPPFEAGDRPLSGEHRFLIEVDSGGRLRAALPLEGPGVEVEPAVERWLRRVVFDPVEPAGRGWFVVRLRFVSGDD
jgi:hypothetical protein